MANEAHKLLDSFLQRIQQNAKIRNGLALLLLIGLLGIVASFVYDIIPRHYSLNITGGDILSNRHYLARLLQDESAGFGVALQVDPMSGTSEALHAVDTGKLDMAFIQGGLESDFPNIVHVATVAPEVLHFLVRPEIKEISDLRGRLVNLGSRKGGTRVVAKQVLQFSGLAENIDYVEANLSADELVVVPGAKLPDAIVITSFAPSDIVEFLVRERGYVLLEIPFPASLALRYGWVADSKIMAYAYSVKPPVPARDIRTVGVNLHLVANKNVDPRAVFGVLEALYSPGLGMRLDLKINESQLAVPSGYPLSQGSKMFVDRKNPLLSAATLDKIKALFGLVLSVASTVLVVFKWFRGVPAEPERPPTHDAQFLAWLAQIGSLEKECDEPGTVLSRERASELLRQLSAIKAEALEGLGSARFDNPQLPQHLLLAVADARTRIMQAGA
jgi:TRAP-type uncharacterized transport system substrate-binding protein